MQGKIIVQIGQIGDLESYGAEEKPFLKKEVLANTIETFENHYSIEFQNQKIDLLEDFKEGDLVEIKGNLQGRKYEKDNKKRVFMSLVAYSIKHYNS